MVVVCNLPAGELMAQSQSPAGSPSSGDAKQTVQSGSSVIQGPLVNQTTAGTPQPAPLYGLQGVLVETMDGRPVATQSVDQTFNPASAVKLVTALIALRTFGPQHRFATGIWTDGSFDKATATITGSLYVSGRDPSLHYEHAINIARQLNALGIRTVTGDLIVSPDFTLNFSWSAARSGEQFYDTLDSELRSSEATSAWIAERSAIGDRNALAAVPSVAVMGEIRTGAVAPGARLLLTHNSSPLLDILKVLLCYSNNFMAERVGESLGGVESVQRQVTSALGLSTDQFRIASLSGLGVNRVSPVAMMKILRALRLELRKNRLSLSDIMPVAGVDPGTLEDRFTSPPWRGSVIAKTGTLTRTDGGVSSLIGEMRTMGGETLLFVIMNQDGNVQRFRDNQDSLVMQVQTSRGGPRAFDYVPLRLAVKLANTQSSFAVSSEEYEPVRSTHGSSP